MSSVGHTEWSDAEFDVGMRGHEHDSRFVLLAAANHVSITMWHIGRERQQHALALIGCTTQVCLC